jgi:hypothetical protein
MIAFETAQRDHNHADSNRVMKHEAAPNPLIAIATAVLGAVALTAALL